MGRGAPGEASGEEALTARARSTKLSVMDPFKFTTIAHHDRVLLGPVSEPRVDELLAHVHVPSAPQPPRVLDIGCGKGEMLLRAMERLNGSGVGVDPNPSFIAAARARAHRRVPQGSLTLLQSPLEKAALPPGQFTLLICTGACHAFGDYVTALRESQRYVLPNGWAIFGQSYWKQTPEPEYLAVFGGSEDEMSSLEETKQHAKDAAWNIVATSESSPEDWDDYELAYSGAMTRWLQSRPNDDDVLAFRDRIEKWQDAYQRWGKHTMGFTLLLLRR